MGKMSSKLASQKKELGHAEERTFNAFFGDKNSRDINFSDASADNIISNIEYQKILKEKFPKLKDFSVSLKSGETWQFHLGRIEELSPLNQIKIDKTSLGETKVIHGISFKAQKKVLQSPSFWNKYLGKGSLLCYNNKNKKYTFFLMSDVINFIITETRWELLETGRIKGHLNKETKSRSVITFEYRSDKGQFVLGAHGGKAGYLLFEILLNNIHYHEINFHSEITESTPFVIPKQKMTPGLTAKVGTTFFDKDFLYLCIDGKKWKKIKLEEI
jgi:hypothetical protein